MLHPSARTPFAAAAAALLAAAALGACTPSSAQDPAAPVEVLASFYPLQFVAEQVGGEHVAVGNLTPPAADPHSLELSPVQVRDLGAADVVVYLSGMQAAVDDAVATSSPERLVDTAAAAGLAGGGAQDPHFWQDPLRLADVAHDVADRLADADPDHAADYAANADALAGKLAALDEDYRTALAPCAGATLVVSHEAFGYLADRYDLEQVGISGIDPEVEPSPARLRAVRSVIEDTDVETVFFEVITSPKVARTLAEDLGIDAARLDPIEGRADPGADYLDIMRENLAALTGGLTCEAPA